MANANLLRTSRTMSDNAEPGASGPSAAAAGDRAELLLQAAERYIAAGLSVVPLIANDKWISRSALRRSGNTLWFSVASWRTFATRTATDRERRSWFAREPMNLGIVTGYGDLVVVDFDDRAAFDRWAAGRRAFLERCPVQRSRKGAHVLVRMHQSWLARRAVDFYISPTDRKPAGQFKSGMGWLAVWPSIHPTGARYVWDEGKAPWEMGPPRIVSPESVGITPSHRPELLPFRAVRTLVTDPRRGMDRLRDHLGRQLGLMTR
jgi:hypothetical protein